MIATIVDAVRLKTVSDNAAFAMSACGRKLLNGAFKTVEGKGFAAFDDVKGLVIFVTAGCAITHVVTFLLLLVQTGKACVWFLKPVYCVMKVANSSTGAREERNWFTFAALSA